MRKRICPYCDQELEGRYCRGCRRFVKTPLIVDVNYYLNERHPASEESCQYHGICIPGKWKPGRTAELRMRMWKRTDGREARPLLRLRPRPERMGGRERRLLKRWYPGIRAPAPAEVRPGLAGDGPRCGSWPQPRRL